jgi:hypothetical protein
MADIQREYRIGDILILPYAKDTRIFRIMEYGSRKVGYQYLVLSEDGRSFGIELLEIYTRYIPEIHV